MANNYNKYYRKSSNKKIVKQKGGELDEYEIREELGGELLEYFNSIHETREDAEIETIKNFLDPIQLAAESAIRNREEIDNIQGIENLPTLRLVLLDEESDIDLKEYLIDEAIRAAGSFIYNRDIDSEEGARDVDDEKEAQNVDENEIREQLAREIQSYFYSIHGASVVPNGDLIRSTIGIIQTAAERVVKNREQIDNVPGISSLSSLRTVLSDNSFDRNTKEDIIEGAFDDGTRYIYSERREAPEVNASEASEVEAPVTHEYNDNYFDEEDSKEEAPVARRLDFDNEMEDGLNQIPDYQKNYLKIEFVRHIHEMVTNDMDESQIYSGSQALSDNIDTQLRYYIAGFEGRLTENFIRHYEDAGYRNIAAVLRMTNLSEENKMALFREVGEAAKSYYMTNATDIMSGEMELPEIPNENDDEEEDEEETRAYNQHMRRTLHLDNEDFDTQENDWAPVAPQQDLPVAPEVQVANHTFHVVPIAIEGRPVLAQININEAIYDTIGMEDVVIADKLAENSFNIVIEYNGSKFFVDVEDLAIQMDDAKYYACYEDSRFLGRRVDGVSVTNINRNVVLYDIKKVGVGADTMIDMGSITNLIDNHNPSQRAYSIVKTTLTVPSTVSSDIADRQGEWMSGHHCSTGATQVFTLVPAVLVNGAMPQAGGKRTSKKQSKKSMRGGAEFTDAQIEHIARHIARIIKDDHTPSGLNGLRGMTDSRIRRRLQNDWVEDAFINDGTDESGVPLELFQGLNEDEQIPIIERALPIAFTKMIEYLRGNTAELDNLPNVINFDSDLDDDEEINTQPMRFTNPAQLDQAMEQLLARHQQLQATAPNANASQQVNVDPFEDAINAQQYDIVDGNEEGVTLIENNRTVYDPIELEDVAISSYLDSDPNNIVLEFNGTVYPVNKDHIRQQAGDAKYYGCFENNGLMAREVNGARQTNIDRSTILYDIKKASGIMIDGFLEFAAINRLLDPESESRAFSIVKTTKTVPSAVSFDIAARRGEWMSGHHCTTGHATVYTLVEAEIAEGGQNGGSRKAKKTISKQQQITNKQKQLLAKFYNIFL